MIKLVQLMNSQDKPEKDCIDSDSNDADPDVRIANSDWFSQEIEITSAKSVRCAAHTLQLAVTDVLKETPHVDTIVEARALCKKLRTPAIRSILTATKKPKAILDCSTRWHSTLDMLERLLELKSCCQEDHNLSSTSWNSITEIVTALIPARTATKQLQQEQLVIGDFYKCWMRCVLDTAKI